jgi:hypothetical protein
MSRTVRIQGDTAIYPAGACVVCLRPATCEVEIAKVKRRTVRKVRVPFCHECAALRRFRSSRQIVFERIATVGSLLLALVAGLYAYVRVSFTARMLSAARTLSAARASVDVWALLVGALTALAVFGAVYLVVEPLSRRFRSDMTTEALRAVTIRDFDWETTALEFADDEYADQFARANSIQKG